MTETKARPQRNETGQLQAGNKNRMTHGALIFQRTGRVPSVKGKRKIQRQLNELRRDLNECVPGAEDPRKRVLIDQIVQTEGYKTLVNEYIRRFGILNPTKFKRGFIEIQPVIGTFLIAAMNSQRQAILALGLDRKEADKVLDLQAYITLKDAEAAKSVPVGMGPGPIDGQGAPAPGTTQGQGTGGGGDQSTDDAAKSSPRASLLVVAGGDDPVEPGKGSRP
jgi:hypothetical protein